MGSGGRRCVTAGGARRSDVAPPIGRAAPGLVRSASRRGTERRGCSAVLPERERRGRGAANGRALGTDSPGAQGAEHRPGAPAYCGEPAGPEH